MALISEIRRWHWAITWDNPLPANSSTMLAALGALGQLTRVGTKTTVLLAPRRRAGWQQIRAAIVANLNPVNGNAFYANLRSRKAFQCGVQTNFNWRRVR